MVQLKLDPFSLGLFSTKPETVIAIQALEAEGLSLEDAIEKIIRNKRSFLMLKTRQILILALMASATVYAGLGRTFPIEEKPFGADITMPNEAAIAKMQEEQLERIKDYVNQPPAVKGIQEAKTYRAFYYDPIFRVKEDIKTLDGKVIASEGQLVNALDDPTIATACDLIFF